MVNHRNYHFNDFFLLLPIFLHLCQILSKNSNGVNFYYIFSLFWLFSKPHRFFLLILLNIWLKQTFQKTIMYFKTNEQQLFGRNLGCYLHCFQYQMRCHRCIFKFPNKKIRENAPCVTLIYIMYKVLTFYSEKSLCNQKEHLWLLKNNVTNSILKLP